MLNSVSQKYFTQLPKHHVIGIQCFSTECVLQLSTKKLYQRINHCVLVIFLHTCYTFENYILDVFSQNLSIRLVSILSFSQLPSFTYRFCQYLLRETKICFIVSARCTNMVMMDCFLKLAKFPGLHINKVFQVKVFSSL